MGISWVFADFPFRRSRTQQGGWRMTIIKWGIPAFFNAASLFISMWLLHYATYKYVHKMDDMSKTMPAAELDAFGKLKDPGASFFSRKDVHIAALDIVAGLFPMLFFLTVVLMDELRTYTKILVCNAFLALIKGAMGAMTTIPDSSGWSSCQARLGPLGTAYFKDEHSMWDLLMAEAVGVQGHRFRWCADMMYSGHTYFTTLYALGLYELARMGTCKLRSNDPRKIGIHVFIGFIAVCEQILEIYCVISDRFHYSMDIAMAIIITFLFFTNGAVAIVAKRWVFAFREAKCMVDHPPPVGPAVNDLEMLTHSGGDILLPPCCVPFCCLAGREHIYDDQQIGEILEKLLQSQNLPEKEYKLLLERAKRNLCMDEGIQVKRTRAREPAPLQAPLMLA